MEKNSAAYLFESVDECPEEVVTEISGRIPDWISGCLLRNGPGKYEFGEHKFNHWFDGSSILQKFNISRGQVTFQSRFLESNTYINNTKTQRLTVDEFGTTATPDPCATRFERFKSMFFKSSEETDNTNVNILKYGDCLLATTDSPKMYLVSTSLRAQKQISFRKLLSIHLASAHPHIDYDGVMYISGSSFAGRPKHHLVKVPPSQKGDEQELLSQATILSTIQSRSALNPSYLHSFGMTENYLIYCETPVSISLFRVLTSRVTGATVNKAFSYNPDEMAQFHIIKKSTGEVLPVKFQVKGLFYFHTINSYEDDNHIVMDVCAYTNFTTEHLFHVSLDTLRSGKWATDSGWKQHDQRPTRLVFPLRDASKEPPNKNLVTLPNSECRAFCVAENLVDIDPEKLLPEGENGLDMPQINYENHNARKYRYFYGAGLLVNNYFRSSIAKVDVESKASTRWRGTSNQHPSEPVFLARPRPGGSSEDDGVVLSTVCDTDPGNRDFLLVLDAKNLTEIARAYVPETVRIPYSIHGSYYRI
ncbi:carotenoid-cleaving dioxygenase, mitochondrial-like [Watersipora subatra]|uniref:carotenoid-cleaving dioxygenase, mitochondrial-like n=1 Tax=Watersipora subatra TaxID=2589382 RepID=UPI00355B8234